MQISTPPASVKDVEMNDALSAEADEARDIAQSAPEGTDLPTPVSDQGGGEAQTMPGYRIASPPPEPHAYMPSYRRRYGRNGILHIEECLPRRTLPAERCNVVYDSDDADNEGDTVVYPIDYYSNWNMSYRSSLLNLRSRTDSTDVRKLSAISTDLMGAAASGVVGKQQQQPPTMSGVQGSKPS